MNEDIAVETKRGSGRANGGGWFKCFPLWPFNLEETCRRHTSSFCLDGVALKKLDDQV